MKRIRIIPLLCCIISMTNCSSLDFDERDALDENLVFTGYSSQRSFLYNIYGSLPRVDNYLDRGAMLASATDDAEFYNDFSSIQRFNSANITQFFNPDDQWKNLYIGIRKCNLFLEKAVISTLDEYKSNNDPDRDGDQYYPELVKALEFQRAEARFLRCYFYFELIKRYGGVPIITDLSIDIESDDFTFNRNSFNECTDFILSELNEIIPLLPIIHDDSDGLQSQTGRATKGAAMALKSRLLLYAASPLFNSSKNINLWEQSAVASLDIIKSNIYSLESNYSDLFLKPNSSELIFERRVADSNNFERANFPIGYDGGNTGNCPSQNLVDAYEMQSSGMPIHQEGSGYSDDNPYEGRDPRFYATINYNNAYWVSRNIEIWEGGRDAPPIQNATKTGYYLKKYLNPDVRIGTGQNIIQRHTFYIFRLGEVYLNFSEAMNEAFGPESDPRGFGMTALDAVNVIRARANMPAFPSGLSKEAFREKLMNERRVELAFENHRFWDVRRWKIANDVLNQDLVGVTIEKIGDNQFKYTRKIVEKRYFNDKMYLYPIPYSESVKSNLEQNPGW